MNDAWLANRDRAMGLPNQEVRFDKTEANKHGSVLAALTMHVYLLQAGTAEVLTLLR